MLKRFRNFILNSIAKNYLVCPKSGKIRHLELKKTWYVIFFPILGILSLVWFLIRVIPKPSRIAYPCQQLAFSLATSFFTYLGGLAATLGIFKLGKKLAGNRAILGYSAAAVFVIALTSTFMFASSMTVYESPNQPIGTPTGLNPGRVTWVRDTSTIKWNGSDSWWNDANTDQTKVNAMLSKTLQWLSGKSTDKDAWDALIRYFNNKRGKGNVGYTKGEKFAIKINCNADRSGGAWTGQLAMNSPHFLYALVDQLVNVVGVNAADITIADPSRPIGDPHVNKIHNNSAFASVQFAVSPEMVKTGRVAAQPDRNSPVKYPSSVYSGEAYVASCFSQAAYVISDASMRAHDFYGVTLSGKLHYGSVFYPANNNFQPTPVHGCIASTNPMGSPHSHPVLLGHKDLGGKTVLFLLDGIYAPKNQENTIIRWSSLDNNYLGSVFASQDPVALDSVGMDFIANEPNSSAAGNTICNYLREAALANNPPSGSVYDPEGDGTRLTSLGVHEHWNNKTERKYTKIDFVTSAPIIQTATPTATPTQTPTLALGDANGDGTVNILDALVIARYSAGLNPNPFYPTPSDYNRDGKIDINDALLVARASAGL